MAYTIPRGYNPAATAWRPRSRSTGPEVGVEAEIQTEEWTQYRADRRADKFQCLAQRLAGRQRRSGQLPLCIAGGSRARARATLRWYENPEVDKLLDQAQEVTDQEERKTLYHQAEQLIVDDAPWVFLGYQKHQVVTRANITDFQLQPTYIYYFAGVSKA